MAKYEVLKAPTPLQYGPDDDVSTFVPGKVIALTDDAAERWLRRGVICRPGEAPAPPADDGGGEE